MASLIHFPNGRWMSRQNVLRFPSWRMRPEWWNGRMTINERLSRWTLIVVIAQNKSRLRTNERTNERTNWAKERMNGRTSERTNDEDDEHDGAVIFWVDERSDDVLGFSHYSTCTQLTGTIIFLTRSLLIDVWLHTLRIGKPLSGVRVPVLTNAPSNP